MTILYKAIANCFFWLVEITINKSNWLDHYRLCAIMKKQTQGVSDKTGSNLLTEISIFKSCKNFEGMKTVPFFLWEEMW